MRILRNLASFYKISSPPCFQNSFSSRMKERKKDKEQEREIEQFKVFFFEKFFFQDILRNVE